MFKDITFKTPDIVFGNGKATEAGIEAKKLGAKKVLFITGPHIKKAGIADDVIKSLEAESIEVEVDIQGRETPEPTTELAEDTGRLAKEKDVDLIIGMGGGSIMDVAKMAAALQTNEGRVREYFGKGKVKNKGIPTIMMPTTSGTGAEITKHAIFLDEETDVKKAVASSALLPDTAIVDPLLTVTCPASVTASSGLDAFIHAAEPFVSKMANPLTDAIAVKAISLITRWLGPAYSDGEDIEARYNMALGSMLAGFVLNNSGTSLVHAMAYPLGGEFHLRHGVSLSVILTSCFDYITVARPKKFIQMAEAMGENVEGLSDRKATKVAIEAVEHLVRSVDMPASLTEVDITDRSKVDQWAVDAHAEQRLLSRCVRNLSEEDIKKIYNNAF